MPVFGRFWCKDKGPQNILVRVPEDPLGRAAKPSTSEGGKVAKGPKCPWKRGRGAAAAKFCAPLSQNGRDEGRAAGLRAVRGQGHQRFLAPQPAKMVLVSGQESLQKRALVSFNVWGTIQPLSCKFSISHLLRDLHQRHHRFQDRLGREQTVRWLRGRAPQSDPAHASCPCDERGVTGKGARVPPVTRGGLF